MGIAANVLPALGVSGGSVVAVGGLLSFGAVALLFWMFGRAATERRRAQLRQGVELYPQISIDAQLQRGMELIGRHRLIQNLSVVAQSLAIAGRTGVTVRIGSDSDFVEIEPLDERIEPLPLDESAIDAALQGTTRQRTWWERWTPGWTRLETSRSSELRGFRRFLNYRGGPAFLLSLVLMIVWITLFYSAGGFGRLRFFAFYLVVMLASVAAASPSLRNMVHGSWFVVPGGVVRRRVGFLSGKVDLHLFDRRRCVLCVHNIRNTLQQVVIADAETSSKKQATRAEVAFLLRAWLSPLEPPPVEQLSDLQ